MWLAAAGFALMVAGGVSWYAQPAAVTAEAAPMPAVEVVVAAPRGQQAPQAVPGTRFTRVSWRAGAPVRLRIGELGVAAPVVPITAPEGVLTPPGDPQQLGWWSEGARPGQRYGSALIAGHTMHAGGGALDDLEQLERGARVVVATGQGRIRYRVFTTEVYGKGQLARDAQRIFSQEAVGRLVVLTCEDWDGYRYLSNVVVIADPVGGTSRR